MLTASIAAVFGQPARTAYPLTDEAFASRLAMPRA